MNIHDSKNTSIPNKPTSDPPSQNFGSESRLAAINLLFGRMDIVIPFIPRVLLIMIADYVVNHDICFNQSPQYTLSNHDQTFTYNGKNDIPFSSCKILENIIMAQRPLSDTTRQWSFRVDYQPDEYRPSLTFGIIKSRENNQYDYAEIRSRSSTHVFTCFNDVYNSHEFSIRRDLIEFHRVNSIVTFAADFESNTVFVDINGTYYGKAFKVHNLREWRPFVDIWTLKNPLTITILNRH